MIALRLFVFFIAFCVWFVIGGLLGTLIAVSCGMPPDVLAFTGPGTMLAIFVTLREALKR